MIAILVLITHAQLGRGTNVLLITGTQCTRCDAHRIANVLVVTHAEIACLASDALIALCIQTRLPVPHCQGVLRAELISYYLLKKAIQLYSTVILLGNIA